MVEKIDSLKKDKDMSRSRATSLILKKGFEYLENKGMEELW